MERVREREKEREKERERERKKGREEGIKRQRRGKKYPTRRSIRNGRNG